MSASSSNRTGPLNPPARKSRRSEEFAEVRTSDLRSERQSPIPLTFNGVSLLEHRFCSMEVMKSDLSKFLFVAPFCNELCLLSEKSTSDVKVDFSDKQNEAWDPQNDLGPTKMKLEEFLLEIDTEKEARDVIWRSKNGGKEFVCPQCRNESFWQYESEPEVRKCTSCHAFVRLRVGTLFENSKTPLLVWMRAIHLVTENPGGISVLQLKRWLGMRSYGTTWAMMQKIREALSALHAPMPQATPEDRCEASG